MCSVNPICPGPRTLIGLPRFPANAAHAGRDSSKGAAMKHGHRFIDLTSQTFGKLTVLQFHSISKSGRTLWECKCECGNKTLVAAGELRANKTKSCGCLRSIRCKETKTTHGDGSRRRSVKEYRIWTHIKERCYNPNSMAFKDYGARGIAVCARWKNSYAEFLKDMGRCPQGLQIDRIDNSGNYEPGNCRWADRFIQSDNRRSVIHITHSGIRLNLKAWSRKLGIPYLRLYGRYVLRGWSFEDSITKPVGKQARVALRPHLERVGYRPSARPERNGGVVRIWKCK